MGKVYLGPGLQGTDHWLLTPLLLAYGEAEHHDISCNMAGLPISWFRGNNEQWKGLDPNIPFKGASSLNHLTPSARFYTLLIRPTTGLGPNFYCNRPLTSFQIQTVAIAFSFPCLKDRRANDTFSRSVLASLSSKPLARWHSKSKAALPLFSSLPLTPAKTLALWTAVKGNQPSPQFSLTPFAIPLFNPIACQDSLQLSLVKALGEIHYFYLPNAGGIEK